MREITEKEIEELKWFLGDDFDVKDLTCTDCDAKETCPFAFDPYNTHGDCLAEK